MKTNLKETFCVHKCGKSCQTEQLVNHLYKNLDMIEYLNS